MIQLVRPLLLAKKVYNQFHLVFKNITQEDKIKNMKRSKEYYFCTINRRKIKRTQEPGALFVNCMTCHRYSHEIKWL